MTGFLYNPATVKVVDSYVIDIVPDSEIRVVSVAVFERLESGEQFVVMNTHPAPQEQASYGDHMKKIAEIECAEMEKYKDMPVFLVGDFNTRENQQEYADFTAALGVKNVKYEADQLLHDYAGNGFKAPVENNGSRCIDHIFINENIDAKLYSAVIHDGIERGSDHIPIYADVALKKAA
jgi:endonuclease/exonuclease/phosphatase family metal-dependent hydrolase